MSEDLKTTLNSAAGESAAAGDGLNTRELSRRVFILGSACAVSVGAFWGLRRATVASAEPLAADQGPATVTIVQFSDAGERQRTVMVPRVILADAEWRKKLSKDAYWVLRHEDTERAFTGAYWNLEDNGIFRCAGCDLALFSSKTKFDSGTGWPSFWEPIAKENVVNKVDGSLMEVRTAVSCRLCDGHLGHVFDDGPPPTGLRYCMNSVSLRFVKG
jgi:peptide-methionine (R)-S-oxide reductase